MGIWIALSWMEMLFLQSFQFGGHHPECTTSLFPSPSSFPLSLCLYIFVSPSKLPFCLHLESCWILAHSEVSHLDLELPAQSMYTCFYAVTAAGVLPGGVDPKPLLILDFEPAMINASVVHVGQALSNPHSVHWWCICAGVSPSTMVPALPPQISAA